MEQMNALADRLRKNGAVVTVAGGSDQLGKAYQSLIVNTQSVLVRFIHTPNTHVPLELLHESTKCRWIKSWGLEAPHKWLLLDDGESHLWYEFSKLRAYAVNGIVDQSLRLMNNSVATRSSGKPATNVVSVWVPKSDADYITTSNLSYKIFLSKLHKV
jgi:hypothetical protein